MQHLPEALLHDIWANLRFSQAHLRTTEGDALTVLAPGTLNRDGGPDFSNAVLRIVPVGDPEGALTWTGDVEIHRSSGEWHLHWHDEDPRYDRVILHVVLVGDRYTGTLRRADGTLLPELVLLPHLERSLRRLLYEFYTHPRPDFPCAEAWPDVPPAVRLGWVHQLGHSRLTRKAEALGAAYVQRGELEPVLHEALFRALGYAPNAEPMAELARRVPLPLVRGLADPRDVEAVLFGMADLLPEREALPLSDAHSMAYVLDLYERFARFRGRLSAEPMRRAQWQFFRLRPASFPTRRLAQAAAMLAPGPSPGVLHRDPAGRLRAALHASKPIAALRALLTRPSPSSFWTDHARFEHHSPMGTPGLGQTHADQVLLNGVFPFLLLDAELRSDPAQAERVHALLPLLPATSDVVTRKYEARGFLARDATDAQGLHELHDMWCTQGGCASCAIGRHLLGNRFAEP